MGCTVLRRIVQADIPRALTATFQKVNRRVPEGAYGTLLFRSRKICIGLVFLNSTAAIESIAYPRVSRGLSQARLIHRRQQVVFAELGRGGLASFQARAVTAHIEANLGAAVRVADIAQVAQLSPSHFTRAFKKSFGRSPHAYITQRRLECAMDMMSSTREPLCQIAAVCGFCDQAHFSRQFHRRFGTTPHLWRCQRSVITQIITGS